MNRRLVLAGLAGAALLGLAIALWPRPGPVASGPLAQSVYVWQRAWNEAVLVSVLQHGTNFSQVCALAAEVSWAAGRPHTVRVPINYDALHLSGRPAGLALRIGAFAGPFGVDDERAKGLAELAASLVSEAQSNQLEVAELQLDFDCAESKLNGYGQWVRAIKRRVSPVPVVITALPSWLKRRAFGDLIKQADGYVLQVHSLERPRDAGPAFTLCDPGAARRAVERAAQFGRPFRVALPTYGYLVAFNSSGKFVGLSAEGPALSWPPGVQTREVRADAAALAELVRSWTARRPGCLAGLIWYRLPVAGDRLNWSWPTLAAVMEGRSPSSGLQAQARKPEPGLVEIEIRNTGNGDHVGPVSARVEWAQARLVAKDGVNGFEPIEETANALSFQCRNRAARIRPGETVVAGWLRLDTNAEVRVNVGARSGGGPNGGSGGIRAAGDW
jgi:hypothetical protein